MAPSKLFVLVHDTCFGSWVWDKLEKELASAGHRVKSVQLLVPFKDVSDADEYSQPLLDVLDELVEGDKAVLVAHGMGGINAAIAMDSYPDKIAVAIFVNAFMPDTANKPSYVIDKYLSMFQSWQDTEFVKHPTSSGPPITTMKFGPNFLKDSMCQLSPYQDVVRAQKRVRLGSLFQDYLAARPKFTPANYGSVTRAYIASNEDVAMPLKFQLWQTDNYRPKESYQIDNADHMAMISDHSHLSSLLQIIAEKYVI